MINPFIHSSSHGPRGEHCCREQDAEQHLLAIGSDTGFRALTATLAVVMDMPPVMALPLSLWALYCCLWFTMADSAKGLPAIFAFTGVWGASHRTHAVDVPRPRKRTNHRTSSVGRHGIDIFLLSAYALNTKKDFSYMGGFS